MLQILQNEYIFLEYRNFCYNGSMKNIIITATAESVEQAQALIDTGVDLSLIHIYSQNFQTFYQDHLFLRI